MSESMFDSLIHFTVIKGRAVGFFMHSVWQLSFIDFILNFLNHGGNQHAKFFLVKIK